MPNTVVKQEKCGKRSVAWEELISYSESAIEAYTEKIKALRKSLIFFKKQAYTGMPFPSPNSVNNKKIS